jgi:hypothetical protein
VLLVVGVLARVRSLVGGPVSPSTAEVDRESLLKRILSRKDDSQSQPSPETFCFDPDAAIVLSVGPDRAPGRAEFDDNVDGVVDERREMGAVGSDDTCLAPSDEGYPAAIDDPDSIVISRGGFVPCESGEDPQRVRLPDFGWMMLER